MIRWLRSDNVDVPQLSELVGMLFGAGLNTVAERSKAGTLPDKTGHVRFAELMSDPVTAIEAAYDGIGRELTPTHRDAVLRYLQAKPRAKHGTHDYTAETFGLSDEQLARDFAPYTEAYL